MSSYNILSINVLLCTPVHFRSYLVILGNHLSIWALLTETVIMGHSKGHAGWMRRNKGKLHPPVRCIATMTPPSPLAKMWPEKRWIGWRRGRLTVPRCHGALVPKGPLPYTTEWAADVRQIVRVLHLDGPSCNKSNLSLLVWRTPTEHNLSTRIYISSRSCAGVT